MKKSKTAKSRPKNQPCTTFSKKLKDNTCRLFKRYGHHINNEVQQNTSYRNNSNISTVVEGVDCVKDIFVDDSKRVVKVVYEKVDGLDLLELQDMLCKKFGLIAKGIYLSYEESSMLIYYN